MPFTPKDARDLLIGAVLSPDPVLYIDDRWLYESKSDLDAPKTIDLSQIKPQIIRSGDDVTIVSAGYSSKIALETAELLESHNISSECIDLRVINPLEIDSILESVLKTKSFVVIDGGWAPAGLSAEIIASVIENLPVNFLTVSPMRFTLPFSPAPSAKSLENLYYLKPEAIAEAIWGRIKR
jgi:pyruvate dehydrogenase E1 component beta subunit